MTDLSIFLDRFGLTAYAKQLRYMELFGNQPWSFDKPGSFVSLEESKVDIKVQVLGLDDLTIDVWRWAWFDMVSDFPEHSLKASKQMREFGEENGLEECVAPESSLDVVTGMELSIIALGVTGAQAYIPLHIPDQAVLYVLADDDQIDLRPDRSPAHVASMIGQGLMQMPLQDHRAAVSGYLKDMEYDFFKKNNKIVGSSVSFESGTVEILFNSHGSLIESSALFGRE